jgi:carbon storage regulator
MLVITRKVNEQIVIGDAVRIWVVSVRGRQVRIGIQAPAGVSVRRQELAGPPPGLPGVPGRREDVRQ